MDNETVRTICYLSRLKIDDKYKEKIISDLDNIVEMIDKLNSVNTKKIKPLFNPLEQTSRKFEDKPLSDNKKEEFLKNAPESDKDYFIVPKVVE
tara:strand:- start:4492 stop:4773 length:282 start_codon:yes stop_codon:yes gene_type:complete